MKVKSIKKVLHEKPRTLAVEADLTAAYMYGFERGKDTMRTDLSQQKELVATLEKKIETQETVILKMTEALAHQWNSSFAHSRHTQKLVRVLAEQVVGLSSWTRSISVEQVIADADAKVNEQEENV